MMIDEHIHWISAPGLGVKTVELRDLASRLLHQGRTLQGHRLLHPAHQIKLQVKHLGLLAPVARTENFAENTEENWVFEQSRNSLKKCEIRPFLIV